MEQQTSECRGGSSVEAEYIALARCVRESLWVRKMLNDFRLEIRTIELRADNQGAIALAKTFNSNAATKHIDVAYPLPRDYSEKGYVSISYISSANMVADGMTKGLDKTKLAQHRSMYGLIEVDSKAQGSE